MFARVSRRGQSKRRQLIASALLAVSFSLPALAPFVPFVRDAPTETQWGAHAEPAGVLRVTTDDAPALAVSTSERSRETPIGRSRVDQPVGVLLAGLIASAAALATLALAGVARQRLSGVLPAPAGPRAPPVFQLG